ncbi:hypothetical protein PIB30_066362 [Stylosanthes scabra]|uniref:Uncharacterized protein n=1 Tax=Stylosanthes scabra TaxID=79078 RepID=A0ABU6YPV8_9FABA|nr:hypothetical protein [Stylosanthes scabra]
MEKGKEVVVVVDDPYSWVSNAIKNQSSLFTSDEAMEMLSEGSWVRKGEKIKVEFLPCLPNDRVCERREDVAYHYVYVGLHPNSWAFIRAFEPIQILDVENRTEFEEFVLEFLTSIEVMEEVLSCAELIKWEEDSEKALGLNTTSMKAFLRQRASRKEVSVSEMCNKSIGGRVAILLAGLDK